jgi:hypothetical protein
MTRTRKQRRSLQLQFVRNSNEGEHIRQTRSNHSCFSDFGPLVRVPSNTHGPAHNPAGLSAEVPSSARGKRNVTDGVKLSTDLYIPSR